MYSDFHRKGAKNAKKSKNIVWENLQSAELAIVASIGYSGRERYKAFIIIFRDSFAFFAYPTRGY